MVHTLLDLQRDAIPRLVMRDRRQDAEFTVNSQ